MPHALGTPRTGHRPPPRPSHGRERPTIASHKPQRPVTDTTNIETINESSRSSDRLKNQGLMFGCSSRRRRRVSRWLSTARKADLPAVMRVNFGMLRLVFIDKTIDRRRRLKDWRPARLALRASGTARQRPPRLSRSPTELRFASYARASTAGIYASDYPRIDPLRAHGLSTHVMTQVRAHLPTCPHPDGRFLAELMLATGLRPGDACALTASPSPRTPSSKRFRCSPLPPRGRLARQLMAVVPSRTRSSSIPSPCSEASVSGVPSGARRPSG